MGPAIDKYRSRRLQCRHRRRDLGQLQDRFVRVEGKGPDHENLAVDRVLPEEVEPVGIERPDAGHPAEVSCQIEVGRRKWAAREKTVFVRALDNDVAIEKVEKLQRRIVEGALETELHLHQQHRKTDARDRPQQARLARQQASPRQR